MSDVTDDLDVGYTGEPEDDQVCPICGGHLDRADNEAWCKGCDQDAKYDY